MLCEMGVDIVWEGDILMVCGGCLLYVVMCDGDSFIDVV